MSTPTNTTGSKTGYIIALVVAVVTLVGSMLAVGLYAASNHTGWGPSNVANSEQWRSGLGQGGMMGGRNGGSMMGGRNGGGMMGGWSGTALTQQQATQAATTWLAANRADATLGAGVQMPMGWLFAISGGAGGSLMVYNNGQVTYYDGPSAVPSAGSGT